MKSIKFRHLLLYLFFLQLAIPIPTLAWGEPVGVLVGALIAAALTPLAALGLKRIHRFLLRLVEERAAQLALSAQDTSSGELWLLPILKVVGAALARWLSPISIILLIVYLSGILPGVFDMLFVFLQILFLLVILGIAALLMLGKAHPDLLRMLASILFQRRKRDEPPAGQVIIVTDAHYEQAPPGIPIDGPGTTTHQLGYWPDGHNDMGWLAAGSTLLLLSMPQRHDGMVGLPETPEQEGD